jgi:hypothetical protein
MYFISSEYGWTWLLLTVGARLAVSVRFPSASSENTFTARAPLTGSTSNLV